jgi:large subunit ribosomal protein L29
MKQTKTKDLQGLSALDLTKKAGEAREQLFTLRLRKATRQLEDTSGLRALRRDIARFKTLAGRAAAPKAAATAPKAAAPAKKAAAPKTSTAKKGKS